MIAGFQNHQQYDLRRLKKMTAAEAACHQGLWLPSRQRTRSLGSQEAEAILGRSSQLQVVNNHGDGKSPKDRVVGPLPNGHSWPYIGVTHHLLTGMILQVG